jgi:hypothetical protein
MDPFMDDDGDYSSDDSGSLEVSPTHEVVDDNSANVDGGAPPTPNIVDMSTQECPFTSDPVDEEETIIRSRAYQIEMFEESLKQNIIVAVCRICCMSNSLIKSLMGRRWTQAVARRRCKLLI